jgi:hypothetical protein
MILRSLANAIREQNWVSVTLEVAIVVVGIFIGLQVDDWNQRRLERESDQQALILFVDELESMLEESSADLIYVRRSMWDLTLGTEIALKCDASDAERSLLTAAIGNTLHWRVPDVRPSGLAEISNSGTLARIGNPELTSAVGSINQNIKANADSMALIGPQYGRAWQMVVPYLVLTHPIKLEKLDLGTMREPPPEYMSLLPHEMLCSDQEFLMGLSLLTNFYESSVYNFESWDEALTTAHELAVAEIR